MDGTICYLNTDLDLTSSDDLTALAAVQEGNVVLVRTIKRFEGSTAAEFLCELTKQVEGRLTVVVEHPDLLV